jgi:hypothetical protein
MTPSNRVIRTDTSKGFIKACRFYTMDRDRYDEADTIVDSDYYKKHINDTDPKMADEVDALKKQPGFIIRLHIRCLIIRIIAF